MKEASELVSSVAEERERESGNEGAANSPEVGGRVVPAIRRVCDITCVALMV